ncbi:uncharacterized protein N7498_005041 [Penicillium cinerascens]|uniref:DUF7707 domain-containing protein n=1 Tax=Penicillium cinerascens TaxID=70096 RepID=A0A9W9MMS6_9EURO|nr:uncharacterized protein N7498_005041 [Penicillium cinerascens]KAJ5204162.1 hypothetical protein N7498_005041 [Penicillium cinerascens]
MYSSIVLLSTLAASALGASNSSSYTFPSDFNIGLVKPDQLNSWCQGQRNVCPDMCDGSTSANSCDPTTLQFQCTCSNGTVPDSSQYMQTVPFYVCQATYGQCIDAHPNDAEGQTACKDAAQCGTKNATALVSSSSSTSATSTMTMTTSTTSSQTSSTSSVAAESTTKNAAITVGEGYSTGIMAGAMFLAARMFL